MSDTGNQGTLTLATTGDIGAIVEMTLPDWTLEPVEDSHLGTTNFKTYIPGDLAEPGQIVATVIFDQKKTNYPAIASTTISTWSAPQTVTVTFPIKGTATAGATLAASGFVSGWTFPQMANNTLMTAQLTITLDGKTEPAFTAEA